MALGHWNYEISLRRLLVMGMKGVLLFGVLYCGDACNVRKNTQFLFGPPTAKDSYPARNVEIVSRKEYVDGRMQIRNYYRMDGTEFLIESDGVPDFPVEIVMRKPDVRYHVESSIRRGIEEHACAEPAPVTDPDDSTLGGRVKELLGF